MSVAEGKANAEIDAAWRGQEQPPRPPVTINAWKWINAWVHHRAINYWQCPAVMSLTDRRRRMAGSGNVRPSWHRRASGWDDGHGRDTENASVSAAMRVWRDFGKPLWCGAALCHAAENAIAQVRMHHGRRDRQNAGQLMLFGGAK